MNESTIQIFSLDDGATEIEVKLEQDSVWLNLSQITELFDRDKSVISRHISSVFKENELIYNSVVAKYATTAADGKVYQVDYYNLDVIISVGYRIKSQRGTQFRIWANKILKEYLIQGYSINENALKRQNEKLSELQKTIKILSSAIQSKELTSDESNGLLSIISDYSYALDILDKYDYQSLSINNTSVNEIYRITYTEAIGQINLVRTTYGNSELFGREKDESFKSSISTIYQTFDGKDLYPSIEEKAAHLLYFVTKNHSFTDGNKRIAAFMFLYFLSKNGVLYDILGNKRIADNTLVALTLMIAVSKQEEMDVMIKVIVNLINTKN
jgi:prophage maintenance system killer protein